MKKKENYYMNQHSCFLLQYHFVLVTKYRHLVINNDLKNSLINYTNNYFKEKDMNILEINTDEDHIHIMFEAYPNMNLSTFINAFKSASSRYVRTNFAKDLEKFYWKPYFWSKSYFICTVSERNTNIVKEYIRNQDIK